MADRRPLFTENFSANLSTIETFLGPGGVTAYRRLLSRLFDDIIPNLCRFPHSGREFFAHPVRSAEVKVLIKKLKVHLDQTTVLREFIVDDYMVLYHQNQVVFLSIKHHRQLSFDFKRFWQES
jgi:hypothetical protein